MITARVSHLAAFARWREDEDSEIGWLIDSIKSDTPTPAMSRGTAFHKFLEHVQVGETDNTTVDGYTFCFTGSFDVYLPMMREWRKEKDYGGIIVSGQLDAIVGKTIYDHKTTERFDAESYLSSYQHKFYLDIFEADQFEWLVWEMSEMNEPNHFNVHSLHRLTQYRYPEMGTDCLRLAQEYREFAEQYLVTA